MKKNGRKEGKEKADTGFDPIFPETNILKMTASSLVQSYFLASNCTQVKKIV